MNLLNQMTQDLMEMEFTAVQKPRFSEKTIFHVGVSGGKDSSAVLLWMLKESGIPKERIVASFCDIGNDHPWTIEHVEFLSKTVHPIETIYPNFSDLNPELEGKLGFFDLALHKHRFPSTKVRFCTEFLKIYPTQRHIRQMQLEGKDVIAVSGVRSDESEDRSKLCEWDYSGNLFCFQWRPIIHWNLDQVLAYHKEHGIPLNPLYSIGAKRVGCWPCIMSRKEEIRIIALKFPERIDEIRKKEQEFEQIYGRYYSFFPYSIVPERFRSKLDKKSGVMIATIDDVVKWSLTGDRAQGSYLDNPEKESKGCSSGFCE